MSNLEYFKEQVALAVEQEKESIKKHNEDPKSEYKRRYDRGKYSYGAIFEAALLQKTVDNAARFLYGYAEFKNTFPNHSKDTSPLEAARNDLGYMAGYYDEKVALEIEELYGAYHPIFGHRGD